MDYFCSKSSFTPPPTDKSHRRFNPLTQEWIIVSPNRIFRPWSGAIEKSPTIVSVKSSDSPKSTLLSPGAKRDSGIVNPDYTGIFTFKNDFPALSSRENSQSINYSAISEEAARKDPLFAWAPATGECYVMCFHPRSDLTLSLMEVPEICEIIREWCKLTQDCKMRGLQWIQIFENRGEMMGCSNPHPHCQIWASDFLPSLIIRRDSSQRDYFLRCHGRVLLTDYLHRELEVYQDCEKNSSGEPPDHRIVVLNKDWVCLVPWWASWPFETLILPRRCNIYRLIDLLPDEITSLAELLSCVLIVYDNLFHTSCPYSFGWYQAPLHYNEKTELQHWQLHGVFLPPLLRSASVRKFMVGFELLAETQRDLTPEKAAEMLRDCVGEHYTKLVPK